MPEPKYKIGDFLTIITPDGKNNICIRSEKIAIIQDRKGYTIAYRGTLWQKENEMWGFSTREIEVSEENIKGLHFNQQKGE